MLLVQYMLTNNREQMKDSWLLECGCKENVRSNYQYFIGPMII